MPTLNLNGWIQPLSTVRVDNDLFYGELSNRFNAPVENSASQLTRPKRVLLWECRGFNIDRALWLPEGAVDACMEHHCQWNEV